MQTKNNKSEMAIKCNIFNCYQFYRLFKVYQNVRPRYSIQLKCAKRISESLHSDDKKSILLVTIKYIVNNEEMLKV